VKFAVPPVVGVPYRWNTAGDPSAVTSGTGAGAIASDYDASGKLPPRTVEFVERLKKANIEFSDTLLWWVALGYDGPRIMADAFKAVGTIDDPSQKTALLSAGIAEAMWNTFLGLLIAVIFMVAHLVLHGLTKRHKHEMEKVTMQLENLLTLRRQGG